MKYTNLSILLVATSLCLAACGKTPDQQATDATADRLNAEAKEVQAHAAATADGIKKEAVVEADATKKAGDARAENLNKVAEQLKATPTATPTVK